MLCIMNDISKGNPLEVQTVGGVMKPSDYLRPDLVPGGEPFIDDMGIVHVTDTASVREVAESERRGDFSMGVKWIGAAMAGHGITLPERLLSVWYFPWSASLKEPDGSPGRWAVLHEILKEYLTKQAVRELGAYINDLALGLVRDSVKQQVSGARGVGMIDLAEFSDLLAFHAMSELAGFPHAPADVQFMMRHLREIADRTDFLDAFRPEAREVGEYFDRIVDEHRRAGKGGLLAHIIRAYDAGRITWPERNGLILGCWSAGRDTTATLTTLLFGLVDEEGLVPKMAASLDDAGEPWRKAAIAEASRFTPFAYNPTISTREVVLANGFRIPALSTVRLHWAAANRDPSVFGEDADRYRPDRPTKRNFAFGHGLHYCLGEVLALHEVDAAARAVYGSLPGLHVTAWHRQLGLVDVIDVATAEYNLEAAARILQIQ